MEVFVGVAVLISLAYALIIWRYSVGISLLNEKKNSNPIKEDISLVIALKNEEANVPTLIEGIQSLSNIQDLEVILVDDHSMDNTLELIKEIAPENWVVITNDGHGKKKAIHTGVRVAKNEWIVTTDADCIWSKDWVKEMYGYVAPEVNMVLGPVFIDEGDSDFLGMQKVEFYGLQGATAGSAALGQPISANGANMMFRKSVYNKVKPYSDNYHLNTGDDQYLMMAVQQEEPGTITYAYNPNAVVKTKAVSSISKYWEQRIRWASKGSTYTDLNLIFTGLIVFLGALIPLEGLIWGIVSSQFYLLVFLGFKMMIDLLLIRKMIHLTEERISVFQYLVSGMVYPFVVVVSVILGFVKRN